MELTYLLKRFLLSRAEVFRPTKKEVDGVVRGERKGNGGLLIFQGRSSLPLVFFREHTQKDMSHSLVGASVSSFPQFVMQLNHVVTPLRSSLPEVGQKSIKLAGLFTDFALGKLPSFQPSLDCAVAYPKTVGDGLVGESLFSEHQNLLIAS